MRIVDKRIGDIQITAPGQMFKGKFELDKTVKKIKGIKMTSDQEGMMCLRGTQRIVINGQEIFEENWESKNLQCTMGVDINKRYKDLEDMEPGNGIIEVDYTDTEHPSAPFIVYRVSVCVAYVL